MSGNSARLGLLAAALVGLAGCASTPPEQDPVQIKLNDLDTRLARIEHLMTNQSLLQLANEIEALRADVRGMHDEVDKLGNEFELARKRQRDLYADVDQRLKALETHAPPVGTVVAPVVAPSAPPSVPVPTGAHAGVIKPDGTDSGNYQAAFSLLKDSQYDQAVGAFTKFLSDFPDSALADNAQYWLGEAYYVNREYPSAITAFQKVTTDWPDSRKAPDALVKIGFTQSALGKNGDAKVTLEDVVKRYPGTEAAQLATERLKHLSSTAK
jgi:tol-pal system protein YbgF